jgi:hypothetical protein
MWPHDSLVDLKVGWTPAQALNIDTPLLGIQMESLESTRLACQLNWINVLVSSIVSRAWVALRVFIWHRWSQSIKDCPRGNVFGGDKDDRLALPLNLKFLCMKPLRKWAMVQLERDTHTIIAAISGSLSTRDFSSICKWCESIHSQSRYCRVNSLFCASLREHRCASHHWHRLLPWFEGVFYCKIGVKSMGQGNCAEKLSCWEMGFKFWPNPALKDALSAIFQQGVQRHQLPIVCTKLHDQYHFLSIQPL